MRVVESSAHIEGNFDGVALLKQIEAAGRTCYKSEGKITDTSYLTFVRNIIKRGHEAVIEHGAISVRFIVDRGVSHEIVRHRMASYCQESTRYCNYAKDDFGNEIAVIRPAQWGDLSPEAKAVWETIMEVAEKAYFDMLKGGASPQNARSVLPNSLKTEVVMTANPREWRHFFKLRCSVGAHPDMRKVALELLDEMHSRVPVLFDDLWENLIAKGE